MLYAPPITNGRGIKKGMGWNIWDGTYAMGRMGCKYKTTDNGQQG